MLICCADKLQPGHTHLIRTSATERTTLTARLGELVREFYSRDFGSELSAHGLFLQFMVQLNRMATRSQSQQEETKSLSPLVQTVLEYITDHIQENLSLEDIADQMFVSKYHLSHEFSKRVGTGIYRYIMFRRLMHARELLENGTQPGDAYGQCGFGDYANFYRSFKSFYGVSPRDYAHGDRGRQV